MTPFSLVDGTIFFVANCLGNFSKIGERFAFFTRPELRLRHVTFKFMSVLSYRMATLSLKDSFAARDIRESYEFQVGPHLSKSGYQLGGSTF